MRQRPTDDEVADLVRAAQDELPHATRAFEQLVRHFYPFVRRVAHGMLADADEADGATQDVMLRVFHALPTFRGDARFSTWLVTVTHNVCRTRLARLAAERRRRRAFGLDREALTGGAEPGTEQADEDGASDRFSQLLAGLNEQERTLLALRFVADLELNQIASITGKGLSATKMAYYRALDRLRAAGAVNPVE